VEKELTTRRIPVRFNLTAKMRLEETVGRKVRKRTERAMRYP
jgi:hypothetical protein